MARCACRRSEATIARRAGTSSARCAACCATRSSRAPPACPRDSPTRPACTRTTTSWWRCARCCSGTGAAYTPHHRNYGAHAIEAYRDSIEIARQAGVPLHLAHCHLGFPQNRGRAPELLAMLDAARADGVEVTLDTYPYLAGSTYLHAFLPGWAMEGGAAGTVARLRDPALRERLRHELEDVGTDGHHGVPMDWSLVVTGGSSIAERAAERGAPAGRRLLRARAPTAAWRCPPRTTSATRRTCARSCSTRATRAAPTGSWSATCPTRAAGARSRATSRSTCASSGLLRLEDAVRRFTSLPARILRLPDRGLLRPGMAADVSCFDAGRRARHRHVRGAALVARSASRTSS